MNYGLPYLGSKNHIAKKIVGLLPAAKNFYDLFAGGCAITHAAALTDKYENIFANDITESARLFRKAIKGRINLKVYEPEMPRAAFHFYKKIDLIAAIVFSYATNLKDYIYGNERRGRKTEHLERLARIDSLKKFSHLQHIRATQNDYRGIEIKENSVIYCDIPYNGTRQYLNKFSQADFLKWAESQTLPIFISSYQLPPPWVEVWAEKRTTHIKHEAQQVTERLFTLPKFAKLIPKQATLSL